MTSQFQRKGQAAIVTSQREPLESNSGDQGASVPPIPEAPPEVAFRPVTKPPSPLPQPEAAQTGGPTRVSSPAAAQAASPFPVGMADEEAATVRAGPVAETQVVQATPPGVSPDERTTPAAREVAHTVPFGMEHSSEEQPADTQRQPELSAALAAASTPTEAAQATLPDDPQAATQREKFEALIRRRQLGGSSSSTRLRKVHTVPRPGVKASTQDPASEAEVNDGDGEEPSVLVADPLFEQSKEQEALNPAQASDHGAPVTQDASPAQPNEGTHRRESAAQGQEATELGESAQLSEDAALPNESTQLSEDAAQPNENAQLSEEVTQPGQSTVEPNESGAHASASTGLSKQGPAQPMDAAPAPAEGAGQLSEAATPDQAAALDEAPPPDETAALGDAAGSGEGAGPPNEQADISLASDVPGKSMALEAPTRTLLQREPAEKASTSGAPAQGAPELEDSKAALVQGEATPALELEVTLAESEQPVKATEPPRLKPTRMVTMGGNSNNPSKPPVAEASNDGAAIHSQDASSVVNTARLSAIPNPSTIPNPPPPPPPILRSGPTGQASSGSVALPATAASQLGVAGSGESEPPRSFPGQAVSNAPVAQLDAQLEQAALQMRTGGSKWKKPVLYVAAMALMGAVGYGALKLELFTFDRFKLAAQVERVPAPERRPNPAPREQPEIERVSESVAARAARGDGEAMGQLEARAEAERSIEEVVALARGRIATKKQELADLAAAMKQKPELVEDSSTLRKLRNYAWQDDVAVEALEVIADLPGHHAADLAYEIWVGTKEKSLATRLAQDMVLSKQLRDTASPALDAALDLRLATECAQYKQALPKVTEHGDRRSLTLLARLPARGCGDGGGEACACLEIKELRKAVRAVRARAEPKF